MGAQIFVFRSHEIVTEAFSYVVKASLLTKAQQTKGRGGGKGEEQSRVYEKAKGH